MISKNANILPDTDLNVAEWEPKYIDIQEYVDKGLHLGGFLYSYDVKENIRLIHNLYPKTQNIALITDNTYGGLAMQTLLIMDMEIIKELNLILIDCIYFLTKGIYQLMMYLVFQDVHKQQKYFPLFLFFQ